MPDKQVATNAWDKPLPSEKFGVSFDVRYNKDTPDNMKTRVEVTLSGEGVTPRQLVPIAARSRIVTLQSTLRSGAKSEKGFNDRCKAFNGSTVPLMPSAGRATQRVVTVSEAEHVLFSAVKDGRLTLDNCSESIKPVVTEFMAMVEAGEELG